MDVLKKEEFLLKITMIAYINYEDIESARKAVSAMNGSRYEYMIISVELLNR